MGEARAKLRRVTGHQLQVALDMLDLKNAVRISRLLPIERVILEVGTPLLKAHGMRAVRAIKKESLGRTVIADTKTLDAAEAEVQAAWEGGADGATVSALAPVATIEKFIAACRKLGMICLVDLMGYSGDIEGARDLFSNADVLICHIGIDQGLDQEALRTKAKNLRRVFPDRLIAVAGGIVPENAKVLLRSGADIVIVGRYVTTSENPRQRATELLELMVES